MKHYYINAELFHYLWMRVLPNERNVTRPEGADYDCIGLNGVEYRLERAHAHAITGDVYTAGADFAAFIEEI